MRGLSNAVPVLTQRHSIDVSLVDQQTILVDPIQTSRMQRTQNETHAFFSEHRRDHRSGLTIFVHPDLARTPLTEPPRPEVQAEVTGAEHVSEEERS